ncbi:porin [Runella sp.]|uniref:porin n=1 Tax=Runella sp. TaxID=1960881 RepID=UPI003D0B50E1
MNKFITTIIVGLLFSPVFAQKIDSTAKLIISGYIEAYYSYDFNQPTNNDRPVFVYSHNRHNEFNINLGFIKAAYAGEHVRGNVALMVGTYANANLAAEPGTLRNIFEANVGVKLSKTKNIWLDAGVFASHIGFESAVSKDCWTLTRSLMADNTPYYETGAKISYTTDSGKWFLSGLALNGWQQMRRADGTTRLAAGTQITFKPSGKITLNSSTFLGGRPDNSNRTRFFHNLYGTFQLTEKLGFIADFDYGMDQRQTGLAGYDSWTSWVAILKYQLSPKVSAAGRIENYTDKKSLVIAVTPSNNFHANGYSINFDYAPIPNAVWRIEARQFVSRDDIFEKNGRATNHDFTLTTSLAISF